MTRGLASIALDCRGAAVIELALFAPVFAALLIGVGEIGTAYSTKLQLEQVAQRMVEKVQQNGFDPTTVTAFKSEAATAAGVTSADVTVDYWLECDGTRQSVFASACASGQPARYMNIDIQKTFTPMFKTKYAHANSDGTYTLHGLAGIRFQQ